MLDALAPVEVAALILGQDGIVVEQRGTDKFPVYEVGAVKDLQTREAGKARRCHVIVVTDTADIRVRIVGVDNRVAVFIVAQIWIPCL